MALLCLCAATISTCPRCLIVCTRGLSPWASSMTSRCGSPASSCIMRPTFTAVCVSAACVFAFGALHPSYLHPNSVPLHGGRHLSAACPGYRFRVVRGHRHGHGRGTLLVAPRLPCGCLSWARIVQAQFSSGVLHELTCSSAGSAVLHVRSSNAATSTSSIIAATACDRSGALPSLILPPTFVAIILIPCLPPLALLLLVRMLLSPTHPPRVASTPFFVFTPCVL